MPAARPAYELVGLVVYDLDEVHRDIWEETIEAPRNADGEISGFGEFVDRYALRKHRGRRDGGVPFALRRRRSRDFRGIVYVPSVVDQIDALRSGDVTFEDLAAQPMTMAADTHVSDTVDQFQTERQDLALCWRRGRSSD